MNLIVAPVVSIAFIAIAMCHFYMALGPTTAAAGAVPSLDGRPLFIPSRKATLAVGVVLLLFAGLVAATSGLLYVGLPPMVLSWLSYALVLGLLARAVGEFKYVGFFKRVRGSKFARLDTQVYSPLCVLLALGVAFVAMHNGA